MTKLDDSTMMSESELLNILQCSRDLVIRYDRDIRIRFFNHAAERLYLQMLGVSLEIGLCTYDLFPPEQRAYWDGINQRVLGGESFTEPFVVTDHAGILRTYEVDYHPIRHGEEIVGFTVFARDFTESRAHEAALREKHKLESIGVLAGGIAHDFNNLLSAILGNIDLARNELPPLATANRYLDSAVHATLRGADLTRQLLSYAGRTPATPEPVNLSELVQQLVELLMASVPKNVLLLIEPATPPAWVQGDRAQLQQVVLNLVTNAADAIGVRAGRVTIRVGPTVLATRGQGLGDLSWEPGDYIALQVEDDGCGIDEDVRTRMFDPFFSTKPQGRGLGLSSMMGILRGHHAGLEVSSTVGSGTVFRVLIPRCAAPVADPGPQPAPSERFSGQVLVADDEPAVLAITSHLLARLGFDVTQAVDGLDAIEKGGAQLSALRLAVLDVSMPGHNGHEVAEILRSSRADLRVVFVSGYASDDLLDSQQDGQTWFLPKPFRSGDLRRIIEEALAG